MPTLHTYFYNGYDWERESKAVVASDGKGAGAVLWSIGVHVNFAIAELGFMDLGDLGLDDCPLGIHIWEGHSETRHSDDGEDDWLELVGKFRQPTLDEWEKIKNNTCPWPDNKPLHPLNEKASGPNWTSFGVIYDLSKKVSPEELRAEMDKVGWLRKEQCCEYPRFDT